MASSAHKQQRQLPNNIYGGATAAPPPTPSGVQANHSSTSDVSADTLSRLLLRLPSPTLTLPRRNTRRSAPPAAAICRAPPTISVSDQTDPTSFDLSSFSQLGFLQLIHHSIPSQLANSAELESLALFQLPSDKKESYFPQNWPLGHHDHEDGETDQSSTESFSFDASCPTEPTQKLSSTSSIYELVRALEKVGLKTIDMISQAVGIENPAEYAQDPTRFRSLVWISEGLRGNEPLTTSTGFYPYIVSLQYQIRSQKYWLLTDSGWVPVSPEVDAVMVTIGDVAQVWSNDKLKKVRGRPVACLGDGKNSSPCISITLLMTLPTDSTVCPLLPKASIDDGNDAHEITRHKGQALDIGNTVEEEGQEEEEEEEEEEKGLKFQSISFEDYAWRVSHERFTFIDPLDKYRT